MAIGLHRPTAGYAKIFGKIMTPNSADLRRRIGYIPTNPQFPIGMTPITYLNRYRVNQAKVLLAKSNKTMMEIARAVGFSDSGYFSRVFRRQVGVSPDAYRRS